MAKEGKYIYCIIKTSQERNFGPIGIGGRRDEVLTIGHEDLSMVVSSHPIIKFTVSRENMLAHELVIEEVMKEFDSVLPVRFGTVAATCDETRNLLDRRYREFKNALVNVEHRIELSVKGIWENMDDIFKEITRENEEIKKLKKKIQKDSKNKNVPAKMEIGKMVEEALQNKKGKEADTIIDLLRRSACDHKVNKTMGDEMFMNAAFLVDRGREKEFDNIMSDLSEEYKGRIKFMYTGPLPVFNFVNIVIYPEEWEK
ncbi:MAG: GvpL/GvpF family gas vesicle protein [bacterium]|nr:GvpL/GvpF family gas vesicle protein [bacterium]